MVGHNYLRKRLVSAKDDVTAVLALKLKACFGKRRHALTPRYPTQLRHTASKTASSRSGGTGKGEDIALDGFTDVLHCLLFVFSLADATGQTGTLYNPIAVFAGIEDDLSHKKYLTAILTLDSHI